jgi:adenosylhomocysteinase
MLSVDWYYERMKLVKTFAKEIEVEEVAVCIPLEYKSACLIYELSKYTSVIPVQLDRHSTKEEAVKWLEERGVNVLRKRDALNAEYFLDCAAVLSRIAAKYGRKELKVVELTKTGEHYLKTLKIKIKAVSLDSSTLKGVGENTYGTAFGLLDALLRLNVFLPGKKVKIIGFGRVGKGCARLLKSLGCKVSVWDKSEQRVIEAIYEGFEVSDELDSDIIVTCTGSAGCIGAKEIARIQDSSILINLGAEMEIEPAGEMVKDYGCVKKYTIGQKSYYLVSDGYAANLAVGSGTPIEVMDRTFSAAILALNYLRHEDFEGVRPLPSGIESSIILETK